MGDYFADKWAALSSLPSTIAENPLFFTIALLVGLPIIWWKWRAGDNAIQHAIDTTTHGLRTSAKNKTVAHDTGIGRQDVPVMRPPPLSKGIYFGLFFFGGGAVFFSLAVLPSPDATSKDWWAFAGMIVFTACSVVLIGLNLTRINVSDSTIIKRRVIGRRQQININDIATIEPLGGNLARGARLRARDGHVVRIGANLSGYRDLILRLKGITDA